MLMNAQPRAVSHGFRPFVSRNRKDSYQRFFDMPNNNLNAWGVVETFAPTTLGADQWDYGFGGQVEKDDNSVFSADICAGGFETESINTPTGITNQLKPTLNSALAWRGQSMPAGPVGQIQYNFQQPPSAYFDHQRAAHSGNSNSWPDQDTTGRTHSTMTHLTSLPVDYCAPRNPESRNLMSLPSTTQSFTSFGFMGSPGRGDGLESDHTSPSTVYSTTFGAGETTSDPMAMSFNSLDVRDNMGDGGWWDYIVPGSGVISSTNIIPHVSYDVLPGQRYSFQPTPASQTSNWAQQTDPSGTVSPQALTLNSPPVNMISSEPVCRIRSSVVNSRKLGSTSAKVAASQASMPEGPDSHNQPQGSRPRRKLPSRPIVKVAVPILPSNDRGIRKPEQNRPHGTKSSSRKGCATQHNNYEPTSSTRNASGTSRLLIPKLDLNRAGKGSSSLKTPRSTPVSPPERKISTQRREDLDEFLVKSKMAGMSYKEIRRRGGFLEAESTLRGRFRTLTKKKDERVRKPEWGDNDIRLLKKAVRKLSHGSDPSKQKISWKQVADYIFENGGTYHFGNATCRKRWDQLQGR